MITQVSTEESELLKCLRKIGKGLIASGTAVGVVENTLAEIAQVYGMKCEVMALPNLIMIKLGHASLGRLDFAVQRLTSVQLDKVSEFVELVDHVRKKTISLAQADLQMDRILAKRPRFGPVLIIFGYFLSCIGLTMLFRPDLNSLLITGTAGILVGLITLVSRWRPCFDLLLPIFAAILVSSSDLLLNSHWFNLWTCEPTNHTPDYFPARCSADNRNDRIGFDAYSIWLITADLWCGSAASIVHGYCYRVVPLWATQLPGLPLRSSCFSLVGSPLGHLVIWGWHLHPLVWCES